MHKKSKRPSITEQKIQYVTPETYSAPPKIKENYSPQISYTYLNRSTESKKPTTPRQKQKPQNDYADYNYYFPDSKRLNAKTPAKASTPQNSYEKFYQPQSADAVVHREVSKNGDELTYHYYYPSEESTQVEQKPSSTSSTLTNFSPSSTYTPSTIRTSLLKNSNKKKSPTSSFHHTIEHTSTDPYQYPPVLQRPNEFELNGSDAPHHSFYPTLLDNTKTFKSQSTLAPSTLSPIKMLKPTKKNNRYLPSTTAKPMKIRRPSTESSFEKFSLPPFVSTTTAPHYSTTTRAPELYKYSTVSPISSTTLSDFYIKPSSQVTPTISSSSSSSYLYSDGSNEQTVFIKPKIQYTAETYEQQPTVKETIVYKYVDPQEYYGFESNKTQSSGSYTPSITVYDAETARSPEYYRELNTSTQADMDFYNSFHKNYNYEYFTEQDAGKMSDNDDGEKMETDFSDDRQRAEKKNMIFTIAQEPRFPSSSIVPVNVQDHEVPPPMTDSDSDLAAEASKNQQYFVLYSVDDDNRREKKQKKKIKQEPEVIYHHHHHQHEADKEYEEDFQQFDNEFDSEFDSDLVNSDNVRIVDPSVRGGRPIEFTKDDYLRHIKQAVVQYMKTIHNPKDSSVSSSTSKVKTQKYQENSQDLFSRPTKASLPAAIISSTAGYKSTLAPQQYKTMAPLKLPKNVYTADKLKDAIDDVQDSPHIDLTLKKSKVKPFDLSAIDVGQTYQHVTQFDHSGALKNVEEFDQSHAMSNNANRQKLHFSQQTYHDINNLGHNSQKQKLSDSDNENTYKGYVLPSKYGNKFIANQNQNSYSAMNYDANKLPRIVSQNNDDDEDENKVDDTIDAPIQIINGIPVANPYNIDLNTLK